MNLGATVIRILLFVGVVCALVACEQGPGSDFLNIAEIASNPTPEPTPTPAKESVSDEAAAMEEAAPEPSKTPAPKATAEPTASPTAEPTVSPTAEPATTTAEESENAGGFSAVEYDDAPAESNSQTDLETAAPPLDSEADGFRTHALPGWGSLDVPEDWYIIYSPTQGLLLFCSKDAESFEDTGEEDAMLQIGDLVSSGAVKAPVDILRDEYLPSAEFELELVSEPTAITINDQEAATVIYNGYQEFTEQMTIYQSADGSRSVYLLAFTGEEKWPEYETIFEQIRNSVSLAPISAGPELMPGDDLPEDYAILVDDEQGYKVGYPTTWQGVGPLPVTFSPPETSLPAQHEFKLGTVFIYPPTYYIISDDPDEGSEAKGFTAEGQVVALWDWAGTMAIQDAMMTSELSQARVGNSEYAAAYFVATDQSRDNQPIYGFMGAVTDGEQAVKMISWFDDPQEYQEVWLNIFNSIRLIETESLAPESPESQEPPSTVSVIHLQADGSGDYVSLPEAVTAAPAGATINLGPGTFRLEEPLVIEKAVHLKGAGMDLTEIEADAGEFVVWFSGEGPFFSEDITYRHAGAQTADVVVATEGEVTFERSRFAGAVFDSETSEGGKGLFLINTTAVVRECTAVNNELAGIQVDTDNTSDLATIEKNILNDNPAGVGVVFVGHAQGIARRNECSRNSQGIIVTDQAQPTLEANVCKENIGNGIAFWGESGGEARENDVSHNEFGGIEVNNSAQPLLEENFIRYNGGSGILYLGSSGGTARKNDCSMNEMNGIDLGDTAQPTLEENNCKGNGSDGIGYYTNSGGTARGNVLTGNTRNGISVRGDSQPTLLSNVCSGNGSAGISYLENANGMASKNTCSENLLGFYISEESYPTVEENSCSNNEEAGIYYSLNATGIARMNEIVGNGICIYVPETADPELDNNHCQDNIEGEIVDERQ